MTRGTKTIGEVIKGGHTGQTASKQTRDEWMDVLMAKARANDKLNKENLTNVERVLMHYLKGDYQKMFLEIKFSNDEFLFFRDLAVYLKYVFELIVDMYYGTQDKDNSGNN